MKNTKKNIYQAGWDSLKGVKGTINFCIAQFAYMWDKLPANDPIKARFAPHFENKGVKEINSKHYKAIKARFDIGGQITRTATVKGAKTTYTFTRRCSAHDIYNYFYNLTK